MRPLFCFGGGREEWGGELLRFLEVFGKWNPMHRTSLFVFGPCGTWGGNLTKTKTGLLHPRGIYYVFFFFFFLKMLAYL